jgi:predicted O-methyltransferase YrrM
MHGGWRPKPRAVGGELRWLLDPTDPLRPYNRRLVAAFATRQPGRVLAESRLIPTEGHLLKIQARFMRQLLRRSPWIHDVAEVGFNAGHSSYMWLSSRADVQVTSFDLGDHPYVELAKATIDRLFPGRHQLVTGDSRLTVPAYADAGAGRSFDLIFIDGGHDLDVARADIANCRRLASDRTVVLMDDLEPNKAHGVGPAQAWLEAQDEQLVVQDVLVEDGFPLLDTPLTWLRDEGVVWAIGHYVAPDAG